MVVALVPSMPMRLFIVRHGQTAWNVEGRAQGHTDIPLDDVGRRQAALLARALAEVPIRRVYSSDLSRCLDTARAVSEAHGLEPIVRHDLRERSFGEFEGLLFPELMERLQLRAVQQGVSLDDVVPPRAETLQQVWDRLGGVAEELIAGHEPTAVISHGGTGSLLLSRLVGGTVATSRAFGFGNTGFAELERRRDGLFRILRYNVTAHLDEPVLSGDLEGSATHRAAS
jgi:2,3-bisphosphoglycerate-dependent phosphoglycerate mutase